MYLANINPNGRPYYFLRETYRAGEHLLSRDLFELGPDPGRHIAYPGGNAYYVEERVEDAVRARGVCPGMHEIEDLLWDFVAPDIRHAVGHFRNRAGRRGPVAVPETPPHVFDRRRLTYLRCGRMDQRHLGRVPRRMYAPLAGKSRDELEQTFLRMERHLRATEHKAYVFTIFDLQRHFHEHHARTVPHGLDVDRMDRCFERDLCRLQSDADFWNGMPAGERLNPYLIRYALMYFDSAFEQPGGLGQMVEDFIRRHRAYRPPVPPPAVGLEEAGRLFDLPVEHLRRMDRRDLTRHYRRLALQRHPDMGGDQGGFVRLTEAYQALLRRRPKK